MSTIDNTLEQLECVVEGYILIREVRLYLEFEGFTPPEYRIKLWRPSGSDKVYYTTSHHVNTPEQIGAYISNQRLFDTEAEAVRKAVQDVQSFFPAAIRAGHEPDESWMVPDPNF